MAILDFRPEQYIFDLQVTQILHIKLQVRWHFGSGNEVQNRISRWRPYLIFNQKYFSYFQYEIILASEFRSQNLASRIKREIQYRFSRWWLSQPSWIFDRNDFSCFWSTHCPNTCYQVLSQLAYLFSRRNSKYIFKIRMIKSQGRRLQACSPFFFSADVTGDVQNRFSRWHGHGGQLWFLIRTI